ncbi:Npun_F0494 family protein [Microcoleus sp. FACHB-672]|uniref:Npun_F0494 family protein n=1 Tax=Microcoleus sp. FACHB-672 TaxID=2692825 RepID=UPI00168A2045|nr:Npun_F0494 family protein [Microcoleus sp. FACHB-672]MBD2041138.1 hypothetical protein [Microcoleus sp. FACHB-672]
MTAVETKNTESIQYPRRTIERAERALRCSPFQLQLFAAMRSQSVVLNTIAGESGIKREYTHSPLSELAAENALLWLIQVGLLRREVDGQGITDGFRLTPLGRQLVEKWQGFGGKLPAPTFSDRLYNAMSRWFRFF